MAKPLKSKKIRWPLVRVSWVDSQGPRGWSYMNDVVEIQPLECQSVGWLIQDIKDRITLAAHLSHVHSDNPSMDGVITIPRIAVTRITKIAG